MSILALQNLSKYYGAQDIFQGISATLARGDKVALVGPNGVGKTTLIRIILGLEEQTDGHVVRSRGLRMGYLPQHAELNSDSTLYEEMLSVYAPLIAQQKALRALTEEMAQADVSEELMERYAEAEVRFELAGGYEYENRIKRVLSGLGFREDMLNWPISVLSGGQITRALLAKLLLQSPELLILDEPTNYLDLAALEWLESYLQDWPNSLLIVSHDRYFLDRVVTRVWDMEFGELVEYRGNYSHYVMQKEDRQLRLEREFKAQQQLIAETEDFVRRYGAGQRSKEARGRLTRLNRMERIRSPRHQKHMNWRMNTDMRSGDNVIMSDYVAIGYETRPDEMIDPCVGRAARHLLFEAEDLLVLRGQCVAMIGANGSGKTTFIRTLLKEIEPLDGRLRIGASIKIGYLPQKQDWLPDDMSIMELIMDRSDLLVDETRSYLGRFLFSGDEAYKQIGMLSGGERSRVALAVLTLEGANVLILDEPTTHFDVASQEILQQVLEEFRGTILLVSHDRYLIEALATHIWVVEDGRLRTYEGNYSAYLATKEQETAQAVVAQSVGAKDYEDRRQQRREQRRVRQQEERLAELEAEIELLEREIEQTSILIDKASAAQDMSRLQRMTDTYRQLQETLERRMEEWEQLAHHVAEVEDGA